jgi:uncharacterized protein
MKLEQSFEVDAPIERVWQTLIDVEHVAPCLPGAAVTGRNEDGSYNGTFTVKIGPTTASYTGKLEMEHIDEVTHTATMNAQGTDKRGQGGAKATILSRLAPVDGHGTRVEVVTDYHITGRLARFGRGGMIEDISERLLREFAKRLQSSLAAQPATYSAAPAGAAEAAGAEARAAAEAVGAGARTAAEAVGAEAGAAAEAVGAEAGAAAEAAAAEHAAPEPASTESTRWADTVVSSAPGTPPAEPPTEVAEPAPEAVSPPEPAPTRTDWVPPSTYDTTPAAVPVPPEPEPEPSMEHAAAEPAGEPEPAMTASAEPVAPAPPAPEPPPVAPPPPPAAAPPPSPSAAQTPPLDNPPMPSEPMQGLSLVGSVVWGRVKRNPAPVAAAGVAVVLLMARRRRRRHGH